MNLKYLGTILSATLLLSYGCKEEAAIKRAWTCPVEHRKADYVHVGKGTINELLAILNREKPQPNSIIYLYRKSGSTQCFEAFYKNGKEPNSHLADWQDGSYFNATGDCGVNNDLFCNEWRMLVECQRLGHVKIAGYGTEPKDPGKRLRFIYRPVGNCKPKFNRRN